MNPKVYSLVLEDLLKRKQIELDNSKWDLAFEEERFYKLEEEIEMIETELKNISLIK